MKNKHYTIDELTPFKCIICDKKIELLYDDDSAVNHNKHDIINRLYNNGVVDSFDAGYGSKYDGSTFYFGICDSCIEKKLETSNIVYIGDYVFAQEETETEYRNKLNKNLHRKIKLKNLNK
jgi:hypothetical protein